MAQNWAETNFLSPYGNSGNQGGSLAPWWRDQLDFRRSMWRQTPEATYPDGYLGTIRSRRDDRLLDSLKKRQNQRSYQRGVHKGERVDPGDYLWPGAWNPQSGVAAQAVGLRHAPLAGGLPERDQPQEQQMIPRGAGGLATIMQPPLDPLRAQQLRRLAPTWR